jgi:hypothetical protein
LIPGGAATKAGKLGPILNAIRTTAIAGGIANLAGVPGRTVEAIEEAVQEGRERAANLFNLEEAMQGLTAKVEDLRNLTSPDWVRTTVARQGRPAIEKLLEVVGVPPESVLPAEELPATPLGPAISADAAIYNPDIINALAGIPPSHPQLTCDLLMAKPLADHVKSCSIASRRCVYSLPPKPCSDSS